MENIGLHVKLGAENKELLNKLRESESEIKKATGAVNGFSDNIGVLRLRYRELSQTSLLGKTPEEVKKIEKEMANLRDQMGDYQARVNSMSLDPFQKGAEAVQTMSTMLAGAAGVASLFGGEQEKMNELMQKTVALIAIANAAQTAADFTKQNSLGIYLKSKTLEIAARIKESLMIKEVTAATIAEAGAKGKVSTVTKVITALQHAWNAAVKASPIFILVGVIAAVTAGVIALSKAFSNSRKEMDSVADSAKNLTAAYDKLKEAHEYQLAIQRASGSETVTLQKERIKQIEEEIAVLEKARDAQQKLATETKTLGFGLTKRAKEAGAELEKINKSIIELSRERNIALAEINAKEMAEWKAKQEEKLKIQGEINKRLIEREENSSLKAIKTTEKVNLSVEFELPDTSKMLKDLDASFAPIEQRTIEIGEILSQSVEAGLESMTAAMAESIGMLASGEADMGDVFKILGEQVANFADALGKSLIAAGFASKAFRELFAKPWAAIIAGGVLVATAAVVRAKLKAGISGSTAGGGYSAASVSGSEQAGASSEWQSRTVNLSQGQVIVTGTLRAQGSELVAVIDSENKRRSY